MKLLTVTIPSYNSAAYLKNAVESLLPAGDDLEIIIVDDGSTDNTLEIAKDYERIFPNIVRAIHKENGGHGSAVNTGIQNARGKYFKVVDSDDWVNQDSLHKIMLYLRQLEEKKIAVDMIISNYVYEKQGKKYKKVIKYDDLLPKNKVFSWEECGDFKIDRNIMMHAIIYRHTVLLEANLKLPEHTFYVDNIYAYTPLPYVKKIIYLDTNFYRYFIGRSDQSVNEKVIMKRIDQQILVNKIMIDDFSYSKNTFLANYRLNYLKTITTVSLFLLTKDFSESSLIKKQTLLNYIKTKDSRLYHDLSSNFIIKVLKSNNAFLRRVAIISYSIVKKVYGFN